MQNKPSIFRYTRFVSYFELLSTGILPLLALCYFNCAIYRRIRSSSGGLASGRRHVVAGNGHLEDDDQMRRRRAAKLLNGGCCSDLGQKDEELEEEECNAATGTVGDEEKCACNGEHFTSGPP